MYLRPTVHVNAGFGRNTGQLRIRPLGSTKMRITSEVLSGATAATFLTESGYVDWIGDDGRFVRHDALPNGPVEWSRQDAPRAT